LQMIERLLTRKLPKILEPAQERASCESSFRRERPKPELTQQIPRWDLPRQSRGCHAARTVIGLEKVQLRRRGRQGPVEPGSQGSERFRDRVHPARSLRIALEISCGEPTEEATPAA